MRSLLYTTERRLMAKGLMCIAGVDEVGAGCLAGDVYAAAVVLNPGTHLCGVQDSKRLSSSAREYWSNVIKDKAQAWAIGTASVAEIDTLNIRQASFLAMRRAIQAIDGVDGVLCDGFQIPELSIYCERIVKGDTLVKSIAAASIIAKVARDAYMVELAEVYPEYGFDRHKGYGTRLHYEAIATHGLCDVHRAQFVRNICL